MAKGSEMSKRGYEGLSCAVCGLPVTLTGNRSAAFQAETDVRTRRARIWHTACGRPAPTAQPSEGG